MPLLLGLALLGVLLALGRKSPSGGAGAPAGSAAIDLPADLAAAVEAALAEETDPDNLRAFAATIPQYPSAQGQLLARAGQL